MKKIISLALVLCVIFSFSSVAFADNVAGSVPEPAEIENEVQPRAEETEWAFRIYNGNLEKRLWSNTYGKWLTDWIIVGPYLGG